MVLLAGIIWGLCVGYGSHQVVEYNKCEAIHFESDLCQEERKFCIEHNKENCLP